MHWKAKGDDSQPDGWNIDYLVVTTSQLWTQELMVEEQWEKYQ